MATRLYVQVHHFKVRRLWQYNQSWDALVFIQVVRERVAAVTHCRTLRESFRGSTEFSLTEQNPDRIELVFWCETELSDIA